MHYCTNCGSQLSNKVNFCSNCGFNFVSNKIKTSSSLQKKIIKPIQESPIEASIQRKKKIYPWMYWIMGIILLFGSFIIYNYITYPKNEEELRNLYCDKYWKASSSKVEEIYVNDTLIPKSGGNVGNAIRSLVDNRSQMYNVIQEKLNKRLTYDDFFIIHYNNLQQKYFQFSLSYNNEDLEYKYTNENPKINHSQSRFIFEYTGGFPNEYSVKTDESIMTIQPETLKTHTLEIISLSEEKTTVSEDLTIVDNETKKEIRLIVTTEYTITNPDPKYLSKVNHEKHQYWDAQKGDYNDDHVF